MWDFLGVLGGGPLRTLRLKFDLRLKLLAEKEARERAKVARQSVALAVIENSLAGKTVFAKLLLSIGLPNPTEGFQKA
jgi:hypothetical protein